MGILATMTDEADWVAPPLVINPWMDRQVNFFCAGDVEYSLGVPDEFEMRLRDAGPVRFE